MKKTIDEALRGPSHRAPNSTSRPARLKQDQSKPDVRDAPSTETKGAGPEAPGGPAPSDARQDILKFFFSG